MTDEPSALIERLVAEGPIGMTATARMLGTFRGGKPCHATTPTRWCLSGVKLSDGRTLRLEHYRTAGRLMTSRAAVLRFLAAQQVDPPSQLNRSPAQRTLDAEAAGRELESKGS